jgi:hypothetical protein
MAFAFWLGYQSIQMTGGSKAIVSTVVGTPLFTGITMDQIYDIPHAEDVRFSPDAWPAAGVATAAGAVQVAFTIGSLTAADTPGSVLTAAGTASALTAATAAQSTLTASDQRTGGPGG